MSGKLPRYAREYHDHFLDYLCSATKCKKKEMLKKREKLDLDEFKKFLYRKVISRNRDSLARAIETLDNEIDEVYCFNSSLHFCVASFPESVEFNAFSEGEWNKDIFIDFMLNGVEYYLHAWKCKFPMVVQGIESKYQIMLFANIPEMQTYNKKKLQNQYDRLWEFSKVYKIHVTEHATDFTTEISGPNFWMLDKATDKKLDTRVNVNFLDSGKNSIFSELRLPEPTDLIKLVNHVMYCYLNREQLTRKNSKARKKYEACKVHTIQDTEKEQDVYVPLTVYHASERKSGEYKGGHHSSPVEHDRRAYYRRSRGRGNYDLVDGKMVFIGDMQGKYSLVKKTHVNGKKNKALKIYKV